MQRREIKRRAKTMLPVIKLLITTRALSEPDKGREKLADELIADINRQFPNEVPPAWETVIKLISKARNQEGWPLSRAWHLDSLCEHEMNPSVVPILLKEQALRADENRYPLSVGEALWASRLYSTIATLLHRKPESIDRAVIHWGEQYAAGEFYAFCAGTDFDSSEMDRQMLNAPEPIEGALTLVHVPTSVIRSSIRQVAKEKKLGGTLKAKRPAHESRTSEEKE